MNKKILIPSIVALAVSAGVNAEGINFDGNIELDNNFNMGTENGNSTSQGGRVELNIEGTHSFGDNYVAGKATTEMQLSGDVAVEDVYVEIGATDNWSVRMGRFESEGLFSFGQDVYVETHGNVYEANGSRGRSDDNAEQLMVTKQLGGLYTEFAVMREVNDSETEAWLRPVVGYTAGDLSILAGFEYAVGSQADGQFGYGIDAAYNLNGLQLGASLAQYTANTHEVAKDVFADNFSNTSYSLYAIYNGFGAGFIAGNSTADEYSSESKSLYASHELPGFMGLEKLKLATGVYHTWGDLENGETADTGTRVRFYYDF